ncbi:MAG: Type I transmembrane sorting receptor [Bogoriella megaspora]|nr:MAG: Type I transmembrane sorting receptor [Bogoriella megaspora]
MAPIASVIAFASLASLVIGSPIVELEKRDQKFSLKQNQSGRTLLRSGPITVQKTFKKFGKAVPEHVAAAAAAAAQQGAVTTTPEQYDSEYLTPVTVGGTTLNLDIDTGSSDLWVYSSQLPANERTGHAYYTVSSSKVLSGQRWQISYGDGSGAAGNVYADTVVVGPVTATRQAVEAATSISSEFVSDTNNDGLLGLAFSTLNTVTPTRQTTFFDTVKSTLTSPLFAADLKYRAPGVYDFGFIDTSKYTGTVDYATVSTRQGFWEFTASGYAVAGTTTSTSIDGIADTGTTLLYLPDSVVRAYYARVSGSSNSATYGGYVFPCSTTLPTFSLSIGGKLHTVPGNYINYAPANSAGTTCFGGIQSSAGIGINIFGDIFLKSQYVIFDQTQSTPRIGFGQQS